MDLKKEDIDIVNKYSKECILDKNHFLGNNNFNENGLNSDQAITLLNKNGLNELKQSKDKKWYNYLFESLFSPFNVILLCIMLVLFYTDVILATDANYSNIIVILILVSASTLLEFSQEYRSNKAASKLKKLVATTTTVLRDNNKIKVPVKEVVLGDVVILSAGDLIPADLRLVEVKDLYVSQSSLTGESDAVKKVVDIKDENDIESITDLDNICFMGTNVISGSAKGIVIKTANDTYFGKIAKNITSGKPKTAFQKGLENVSKLLVRFMLVMIPITFLINVWKHDVLTAFTFSVAIAIGITPLLLPVILSSTLAKGAIRMSKKKTIVKKLDSIQSFGAMNILCTDKTGTLTQDKIVLEKYLDVKGNEDLGVLKHAFLNAYFQTGLKGNIDEAIIKRAFDVNMNNIIDQYKKIDEIPFDFSRRRLSVVVSDGTKTQLITKGAVEEILSICTMINYYGDVSPITNEIKDNIRNITKNLNENGLRVIAVCQKNDISDITEFSVNNECNMVLMGFIGFLDSPKESAKDAINMLNNKGVRVIVLTGDNAEVTRCICKKVNINSDRIILGSEIDKLSDRAVLRILRTTNIFAKLSPIR